MIEPTPRCFVPLCLFCRRCGGGACCYLVTEAHFFSSSFFSIGTSAALCDAVELYPSSGSCLTSIPLGQCFVRIRRVFPSVGDGLVRDEEILRPVSTFRFFFAALHALLFFLVLHPSDHVLTIDLRLSIGTFDWFLGWTFDRRTLSLTVFVLTVVAWRELITPNDDVITHRV